MNAEPIRPIPHDEYLALERLSPSGAKQLLRSPAHYRAWRDAPQRDAPALILGRALHCLVLESPAAFAERFIVAHEKFDRRTNAGKAAAAAFDLEAAGRTVLTPDQGEQIAAMAGSALAHPVVRELLEGAATELSLLWTDPDTGAELKGRPDALRLRDASVVDLKTTQDAGPAAFARSCLSYGYHIQAAAYFEGLEQWGLEPHRFVLIALEKEAPYACATYQMDASSLELGRRRWRQAVELYAQCTRSGSWPGYSTDLAELSVPAWALAELEVSDV